MNENRNVEIFSVSLKDRKPVLSFTEKYQKEVNGESKPFVDSVDGKKFGRRVSDDFFNRWNALKLHFAILTDYINMETVSGDEIYQENNEEHSPYKMPVLNKIELSKLHIKNKNGERSIILTGVKTTATNRCVVVNTPLTALDNVDPYLFQEAMEIDIDLLLDEVQLYLLKGKDGEAQLGLFDNKEEEEQPQEEDSEDNVEMKINHSDDDESEEVDTEDSEPEHIEESQKQSVY